MQLFRCWLLQTSGGANTYFLYIDNEGELEVLSFASVYQALRHGGVLLRCCCVSLFSWVTISCRFSSVIGCIGWWPTYVFLDQHSIGMFFLVLMHPYKCFECQLRIEMTIEMRPKVRFSVYLQVHLLDSVLTCFSIRVFLRDSILWGRHTSHSSEFLLTC